MEHACTLRELALQINEPGRTAVKPLQAVHATNDWKRVDSITTAIIYYS